MVDKKLIFSESVYDAIDYKQNTQKLSGKQNKKRKPYLKHYCDDNASLYIIKKTKPINELRRDIYFEDDYWSQNVSEKIKSFVYSKKDVENLNKQIRAYFHTHKQAKMDSILQMFNCVEFSNSCDKFNKTIIGGKFIRQDGNTTQFIGEGQNEYYYFDWCGS
jgi:hypothetical protein